MTIRARNVRMCVNGFINIIISRTVEVFKVLYRYQRPYLLIFDELSH